MALEKNTFEDIIWFSVLPDYFFYPHSNVPLWTVKNQYMLMNYWDDKIFSNFDVNRNEFN